MKTKKMKTKKLLKRLLRALEARQGAPAGPCGPAERCNLQGAPGDLRGDRRPACRDCLWTGGGHVCKHRPLSDGRTQEALDRAERSGATWS